MTNWCKDCKGGGKRLWSRKICQHCNGSGYEPAPQHRRPAPPPAPPKAKPAPANVFINDFTMKISGKNE